MAPAKQTFSTADLVKIISNVARDPTMTSERMRHWAREGLLSPIGGRHPGTGVHRRYSPETAARAAVLSRLADMNFKVAALETTDIVKRVDYAWSQWQPGHTAFLVIAFGRAAAKGAPLEISIRASVNVVKPEVVRGYPDYTVIDLGRIFAAIDNVAEKSD